MYTRAVVKFIMELCVTSKTMREVCEALAEQRLVRKSRTSAPGMIDIHGVDRHDTYMVMETLVTVGLMMCDIEGGYVVIGEVRQMEKPIKQGDTC